MIEAKPPRHTIDIGIVVSDLEKSLAFYRDLLGLPIVAQAQTSLIGKGQMIQMQHGESLIKLVQLESTPPVPEATNIGAFCGFRYATLLVDNVQRVMEKLEQSNVRTSRPVTELGNGTVISMVEDPNGNIIEFVQEAK